MIISEGSTPHESDNAVYRCSTRAGLPVQASRPQGALRNENKKARIDAQLYNKCGCELHAAALYTVWRLNNR